MRSLLRPIMQSINPESEAGLFFEFDARTGSIDDRAKSVPGAFYRASLGYHAHPSTGLLVGSGLHGPRFEIKDGKKALLIEGTGHGVQLCQRSHEFDHADWTPLRLSSITVDGDIAPDGTATADGTVGNTVDNTHHLRGAAIPGVATDAKVALTVYAKPGNKDWVYIMLSFVDAAGGNLGDTASCYFNIVTGATGTSSDLGDCTVHKTMIEKDVNGYYRVGIIASSADALCSKVVPYIEPAHADTDNGFIGDEVTVNTWWWGADVKLVTSTWFDTHLPSSGATRTRSSESGEPRWVIPSGLFDAVGTLIVWVRFGFAYGDIPVSQTGSIFAGTNTRYGHLSMQTDVGGNPFLYSRDNAAPFTTAWNWAESTWYKLALKWGYGAPKHRHGIDSGSGIAWGTEANFSGTYSPGTSQTAYLGLGPMWIRKIQGFTTVLTDQEINNLEGP